MSKDLPQTIHSIPPPRRAPPAAKPTRRAYEATVVLSRHCHHGAGRVARFLDLAQPRAGGVEFRWAGDGCAGVRAGTGLTIKAASGELPPTGGEVDAWLLSGD